MDGMHDLEGKQGFGPVRHSAKAAVFHAPWERRVNARLALAVKHGLLNMDQYHHAIERMETRHYLSAGYYERSMTGLATLCAENGLSTREELERSAGGALPLSRASAPSRTNAPGRGRFVPGDRVHVKEDFVPGHIRMPGYIRGKVGVLVSESPPGVRAADEPTHDLCFRSEDLWPNGADPALVHAGVLQSYLERVG